MSECKGGMVCVRVGWWVGGFWFQSHAELSRLSAPFPVSVLCGLSQGLEEGRWTCVRVCWRGGGGHDSRSALK